MPKRLEFAGQHYFPSIGGRKKITIRKYNPAKHSFTAGDVVDAAFKDVDGHENILAHIRITADTRVCAVKDLTEEELKADGFRNVGHALLCLRDYYPDLTEDSEVAAIRYEMAYGYGIGSRLDYYQMSATQAFAKQMLRELRANMHKGIWLDGAPENSVGALFNHLEEEFKEFHEALREYHLAASTHHELGERLRLHNLEVLRERVREEGADIGNMVMMLMDLCGALSESPQLGAIVGEARRAA